MSYSAPPGYVRTRPPVRPKLDPFIGIIDRILEEDKDRPKKQRHTSKRIFERLRDEYWTLLTKVETSCDRILIAGGANVEAEWEQGPAV